VLACVALSTVRGPRSAALPARYIAMIPNEVFRLGVYLCLASYRFKPLLHPRGVSKPEHRALRPSRPTMCVSSKQVRIHFR